MDSNSFSDNIRYYVLKIEPRENLLSNIFIEMLLKLSEPISVIRNEKIERLLELLDETQQEGSVCVLRGMDGVGKSTFLRTVKEYLENDESISCVYEAVRQADNTQFFLQLLTDLKLKTHPNKEKVKKFFEDHFTILQSVVGVVGAVAGQSELTNAVMEPFAPVQAPQLNTAIQDEFIKILDEFSQKFTDHKVIIMIDGIDSTLGKNLFIAMINDLATKLPSRFLIVVNSSSKEIESDNQLFISNFTKVEVQEFLEKNFENIDEELIEEIIEKSAGYPDSLGWLWRNYKRNPNILQLVQRLTRDGFLAGLQRNFLTQLPVNSRHTLKICATLDLVDSISLSYLANIDQHDADMIIASFNEDGYVAIIESYTGPTGQIFNFYRTDPVIIKLFNTISGKDKDLIRRATDFFAKSIFNNTYALPFYPSARMLALNLSTDNQNYDVKQLFDSIELDADKKCLIWFDLTNILINASNQNFNTFFAIAEYLTKDLKNQNESNSLIEYVRLKKMLLDKLAKNIDSPEQRLETVFRDPSVISVINNLETMVLKLDQLSILRKCIMNELDLFKSFGATKFDDDYLFTIIDKKIETVVNTLLSSIKNKKVADLLASGVVAVSYVDNPLHALACYSKQRELYESLIDEELEIIKSYFKSIGVTYSLQDIEDGIIFNFDVAYLSLVSHCDQTNITDDKIEDLREVVKELEYWKDDPVRGQYYVMGKKLLEDLKKSPPVSS